MGKGTRAWEVQQQKQHSWTTNTRNPKRFKEELAARSPFSACLLSSKTSWLSPQHSQWVCKSVNSCIQYLVLKTKPNTSIPLNLYAAIIPHGNASPWTGSISLPKTRSLPLLTHTCAPQKLLGDNGAELPAPTRPQWLRVSSALQAPHISSAQSPAPDNAWTSEKSRFRSTSTFCISKLNRRILSTSSK